MDREEQYPGSATIDINRGQCVEEKYIKIMPPSSEKGKRMRGKVTTDTETNPIQKNLINLQIHLSSILDVELNL